MPSPIMPSVISHQRFSELNYIDYQHYRYWKISFNISGWIGRDARYYVSH